MSSILVAIALICGPRTSPNSGYTHSVALSCQKDLAQCVLKHECGEKKCQDQELTLMKCVAGQFQ